MEIEEALSITKFRESDFPRIDLNEMDVVIGCMEKQMPYFETGHEKMLEAYKTIRDHLKKGGV